MVLIRKRLDDPLREGALSVLTPFGAFLLADSVHASGVLAVVVAGLVLAYAGPRVIRARSRVLAYAFWDLTTFLINGGLFVLLGTQIPRRGAGHHQHFAGRALLIVLVVALVVVGTRLLFVYLTVAVRDGCGGVAAMARARGRRVGGWGPSRAGPVSGRGVARRRPGRSDDRRPVVGRWSNAI